ncbi:MAG: hypothetical protein EOO89_18640 [Pedobacter sp.]|nr:MAG: hypothetical protein EOO89_18640 [Pedobacter sp.]
MRLSWLVYLVFIVSNSFAKEIQSCGALRSGFIENKGQIIDQYRNPNPVIKYLWSGSGMNVQLRCEGFSYEVVKISQAKKNPVAKAQMQSADTIDIHRIDIQFIGANPNPTIINELPNAGVSNYYNSGTATTGITQVNSFRKIIYKDIYPNIDVEYLCTEGDGVNSFKYNFIVRPGGKVDMIRMRYEGASGTELNTDGELEIESEYGRIKESIPSSFEFETDRQVDVTYEELEANVYGFSSDGHNEKNTLVIDPWATYFGGSGYEDGTGITSDPSGNVLVVGTTNSSANITTSGAHQTSFLGTFDLMVVKFNAGGALLWSTYYGGANSEISQGIATDNIGNVIVAGNTESTTNIATPLAYQTSLSGSIDGFIVKLNPSGNLIWSTYFGGPSLDAIEGIVTDPTGSIVIAGQTGSLSGISTTGAHQLLFGGGSTDAFVARFNSIGTLEWSTYYGGDNNSASNEDIPYGIATDALGNIVIAGTTNSETGIATPGAHKVVLTAALNAFVVKFNTAGIRQWGTYYGGTGFEEAKDVHADIAGNIYIAGITSSSDSIATPGAFQTSLGYEFVCKLHVYMF